MDVPIHSAVALSMGTMIVGSSTGALTFLGLGVYRGIQTILLWTIGYLNMVAFLSLSVTSVILAQFGAMTAHRLSPQRLRLLLAIVYAYVGVKLLGVFGWLHLLL